MATSDVSIATKAQTWDAEARQAWMAGEFTRSRHLFEQVLVAWQSLQRNEEIVYALIHVTQAMRFEPDYDPTVARPLLEEALRLAQQLGTERYIGPVQFNLAWLDVDVGNYAEAFRAMRQLLPLWMQFPDPDGTCHGLELMAKALAGLGVLEPALRLYAAATAIREQRGRQHTVAAYLAHEARFLALVRGQLGAERSAAVEVEGRTLSLDQAVAYALSVTPLGE